MKAITFVLTLEEPFLATQVNNNEPNSGISYPFVPGSMITCKGMFRYALLPEMSSSTPGPILAIRLLNLLYRQEKTVPFTHLILCRRMWRLAVTTSRRTVWMLMLSCILTGWRRLVTACHRFQPKRKVCSLISRSKMGQMTSRCVRLTVLCAMRV